jgi:hypothetical protein
MRTILLTLGLAFYSTLAGALNYAIVQRSCISAAIPLPPFKTIPIPIGCELVDCCPGCPGPGPMEWRVTLDSKVATQAELRFEGLSKAQIGKLKLSGAAKLDGQRILIGPGSARIGGIPHGPRTPLAVGMLQPLPNGRVASRLPQLLGRTDTLTDRILVEQFMGGFSVNRFSWEWVMKPCVEPVKPPTLGQDRLKVDGIAAGDEVSVMLYGRTSAACLDSTSSESMTTFSTTGEKWLGNMLSIGSCTVSEVAVFSKKHAMKWQPLNWNDVPGDLRTVPLDPLISADLKVWITDEVDRETAEEHAQKAQDLFLENRVGVRLNWTVEHVSNVPDAPSNAVEIVNGGVSNDLFLDCQNLHLIRAHKFYVANTLNVYYLRRMLPGRNCAIRKVPLFDCVRTATAEYAKADANINFIGTDATVTTLAHELGHAYGLRPITCDGHPPLAGFGAENIMYSSGSSSTDPRHKLTLGQVFRMNTHDDPWGGTMLIQNNIPSRTPRKCFPDQSGPMHRGCPRLITDWPLP